MPFIVFIKKEKLIRVLFKHISVTCDRTQFATASDWNGVMKRMIKDYHSGKPIDEIAKKQEKR